MVITVFSKIIGFGRDIILSFVYGASSTSDAYLISTTIPSVIFGFIAAGLGAGYIPIYTKIIKDEGEVEANRFTNNLINILIILCTIIIIVCFLFTEQIVKIFASGFEGETLALTVQFTKISLFAMYFTVIVSIFSGYLQIKNNYIAPALIGVPLNIVVIISIILSYKINVLFLAIGFVIASASQIPILIHYIKRNKYKYKLVFDLKDKNIKKMAFIAFPVILGISVNQINLLVDRTIASQIVQGGVSALNYASKLNVFLQGIFVMSIVTVLYPVMSRMAAEKNLNGLKNSLSKAIIGISLLVVPATLLSMIFSKPIVIFLFGRGAFDIEAISMTSYALFFYSIGMVGFGMREVLSRVFFSIQDTKTPMVNAAIGMVINIILNVLLSRYLGIGGIALATSIAAIVTTVLLFISLRKKIGSLGMKKISISLLKISLASLVMGLLAKLSFDFMLTTQSPILSLLIAVIIGIISYFLIIYFIKIDEVNIIVKAVKRKFKKTVV